MFKKIMRNLISYNDKTPVDMNLVHTFKRYREYNSKQYSIMFCFDTANANTHNALWNFDTEKERELVFKYLIKKYCKSVFNIGDVDDGLKIVNSIEDFN